MSREEWREFYRWCESASDEELAEKKEKIHLLREQLLNADIIGDALKMIRAIEEEQLARVR